MPTIHRNWEKTYKDHATPWDMEKPDGFLVEFVSTGRIKPCRVLEIGCGHGNDAIFLAQQGFEVTAVDISKKAIETAEQRAVQAGVHCTFLAVDITKSVPVNEGVDFIYDRACFHFIPKTRRKQYIKTVAKILNPGGQFLLFVSSNQDPVTGPYRFTRQEIKSLFSEDFDILEIRLVTLQQHREKPMPYLCWMQRKERQ